MNKKILIKLFLGITFCSLFYNLRGQNDLLIHADSLFEQQKYTESFEIYEKLYDSGLTSPAVLLKMTFIQEASENYEEALYYTNKYYTLTADRSVMNKTQELVQKYNLSGYTYDDMFYFSILLNKYKLWGIVFMSFLMIALISYINAKRQKKEKVVSIFIIQLVVSLIFLVTVNFKTSTYGIISSDQTLLRSGPSAGAETVEMIVKGHRVKILSKNDIWSKIIWDDKEVYVRSKQLKII